MSIVSWMIPQIISLITKTGPISVLDSNDVIFSAMSWSDFPRCLARSGPRECKKFFMSQRKLCRCTPHHNTIREDSHILKRTHIKSWKILIISRPFLSLRPRCALQSKVSSKRNRFVCQRNASANGIPPLPPRRWTWIHSFMPSQELKRLP